MINYIDYQYSKGKGQTDAGDKFASSINMGVSDRNYTTDFVDRELVCREGQAPAAKQLPWHPVKLDMNFSVDMGAVSASIVSIDPATGVGTLGSVGDIIEGTITPDGLLTLTAPAAAAADITVSYRYNNEDVRSDGPTSAGFTNVPEAELKLNSEPVEATARTMRSFWALTV